MDPHAIRHARRREKRLERDGAFYSGRPAPQAVIFRGRGFVTRDARLIARHPPRRGSSTTAARERNSELH